jgi:nucleolar protein 53
MGKRSRQGAALRATRRANVAALQLEQAMVDRSEETRVQSKDDAELFVLDTTRNEAALSGGNKRRRRNGRDGVGCSKDHQKDERSKLKTQYSAREERQIHRLIKVHGEKVVQLAEEGRARATIPNTGRKDRLTSTGVLTSSRPSFDLWGESTSMSAAKSMKKKVIPSPVPYLTSQPTSNDTKGVALLPSAPRLAVEIAHPGQSYRPDSEQHQDAIGAALSIEIRRNEAIEYKNKPVSDGLSTYTAGLIVGDDDTSDDDDYDDDDDNGVIGKDAAVSSSSSNILKKKRKEKLTRAQRNKQRRVKAELLEIKERKARKAFLHQANEVRIHNKAVLTAEKEAAERRIQVERLRAERKAKPLGSDVWGALSRDDPLSAPTLPVALTEELLGIPTMDGGKDGNGSLRTVIPKGSLVTDRIESMAARNMIVKRKASGGRRIVQGKKRNNKVRGAEGTEYLLI